MSRFDLVTIDTPDTERLARFWSAVLDLVETEREDGDRWLVLGDRLSAERRLGFQRGEHRRGAMHLDLRCAPHEFDDEIARLCALGAGVLAVRSEPYGRIANLSDLDGNLFDLCAYEVG